MVMGRRRRQIWHIHSHSHLGILADFELGPTSVVVTSPAVHAAIPPILHCIVAASPEAPRNLSPPFAHLGDHLLNQKAFFGGDGIVDEIGLQILVETLPALLW